jgi:hypothetical protein
VSQQIDGNKINVKCHNSLNHPISRMVPIPMSSTNSKLCHNNHNISPPSPHSSTSFYGAKNVGENGGSTTFGNDTIPINGTNHRRYKTPSPQLLRLRREVRKIQTQIYNNENVPHFQAANARERRRMNHLNKAFEQVWHFHRIN